MLNQSGVALVLTLARYFKRKSAPDAQVDSDILIRAGWSLWSKDIIFLITEDSTAGPQAWVDAYHSTHNPSNVNSLPLVSGALQGALAIDYPAGTGGHRFDKIHVVYDGINGQLPNLDLVNTITTIATGHMGIGTTIQRMWKHDDSYEQRLETMLRGMLVQGMGQASGPHSAFMPYHVDAVTLQTVGDGWQDEMSLGRLVESTVRSLNNLLEHLHQSFFFYLLMNAERFVSIGTYLPSAMMVAVNFAIMAIALWVQSGRPSGMPAAPVPVAVNENGEITVDETKEEKISLEPKDVEVIEHADKLAVIPKAMLATRERHLLFPVVAVCGCHFLGVVPFYIFNNLPASVSLSTPRTSCFQSPPAFPLPASPSTLLHNPTNMNNIKALPTALHLTTFLSLLLPLAAARIYVGLYPDPTTREQPLTLLPTFSLLLLSACLITLSTLNFPLGLFTGLLASPLTLAHSLALRPSPKTTPPPPPPASTPAKLQTAFQLPSPQATATAQASSILAQTPTTQTPHRPSTHERKRTFPALTQITFYILVTISPPFIIYILAALHSASQALTPANLAFHGLSAHTPPSYSQLLRTAEFGSNESVRKFLVQAAQAWSVSGTWTSVVVWVVWWPAWGVGMFCTGVRLWVDFSRRLEDKGMGRR